MAELVTDLLGEHVELYEFGVSYALARGYVRASLVRGGTMVLWIELRELGDLALARHAEIGDIVEVPTDRGNGPMTIRLIKGKTGG